MKISEVIKKLKQQLETHGDIEVVTYNFDADSYDKTFFVDVHKVNVDRKVLNAVVIS